MFRAHRLAGTAALAMLTWPATCPAAADTEAAQTPETIEIASIADVYEQAIATQALAQDLASNLPTTASLDKDAARLEDVAMISEAVQRGLDRYTDLEALSYSQLLDLDTQLRSAYREIESLRSSVADRVRELDRDLDRIAEAKADWASLREAITSRAAPQEAQLAVDRSTALLDDLAAQSIAQRDANVALLDRATTVAGAARAVLDRLASRRTQLTRAAERSGQRPIWRAGDDDRQTGFSSAARLLEIQRNVIAAYIGQTWRPIMMVFSGLLIAAIVLLRRSRRGAAELLRGEAQAASILRVLDRPVPAALVIAGMGTLLYADSPPQIFRDLGWLLLPLPAAIVCVELFGQPIRRSIYSLAAALMLLPLRGVVEGTPLADRLLVLVQVLMVAAMLTIDARRGCWEQVDIGLPPRAMRTGARIIIALLLLTAVANVIGYVQWSNVMRDGVLGGLGILLILAAATQILYGVVLGLLHAPPFNLLLGVRTRSATLLASLRTILSLVAVAAWFMGTLAMFRVLDAVFAWWHRLEGTSIDIGSVTITTQHAIAALIVLLVTWLAIRIVRFVLDVEILPRLSVASGLHFVISRVVRYLMAVAGFVFALAVLGVDLTKVTVLAGALGVGVGLGLQNIANNFFSGLILLFERPIQVGDLVVVDDMMGEVRRISIRSTTIRTFDGAEVIVPNGDLIAKSVVNWTLSDRQRRAEIDVGVAYGTDPARVLAILKEAAAEHPDVLKTPEPNAVLRGFGDSSLDFRLYLWVSDIAHTLSAPSEVRRTILRRLGEAGIEIPFPQHDLHMRTPARPRPSGDSANGVADPA